MNAAYTKTIAYTTSTEDVMVIAMTLKHAKTAAKVDLANAMKALSLREAACTSLVLIAQTAVSSMKAKVQRSNVVSTRVEQALSAGANPLNALVVQCMVRTLEDASVIASESVTVATGAVAMKTVAISDARSVLAIVNSAIVRMNTASAAVVRFISSDAPIYEIALKTPSELTDDALRQAVATGLADVTRVKESLLKIVLPATMSTEQAAAGIAGIRTAATNAVELVHKDVTFSHGLVVKYESEMGNVDRMCNEAQAKLSALDNSSGPAYMVRVRAEKSTALVERERLYARVTMMGSFGESAHDASARAIQESNAASENIMSAIEKAVVTEGIDGDVKAFVDSLMTTATNAASENIMSAIEKAVVTEGIDGDVKAFVDSLMTTATGVVRAWKVAQATHMIHAASGAEFGFESPMCIAE